MDSLELAREIRKWSLSKCHSTHSSHIASCLSCADILAVLFADVLEDDAFILSKPHAHFAFDAAQLLTGRDHLLGNQPYMGSLGHGLPVGLGIAMSGRRTYVLMGDGEMDEGSVYEAMNLAGEHSVNLTAIIDANGWQAMRRVERNSHMRWHHYGWTVERVNGHDHGALREALAHQDGCRLVVCDTVKGKGVSFMEDDNAYHYKSSFPLGAALAEL